LPARFLWVTDPWETLDHSNDTTLRLAHEAEAQGHQSFWCDVRSIRLESRGGKSEVLLEAARIISPDRPGSIATRPFPAQILSPTKFSSVHYRVDPPVDLAYLHPLHLLVLAKARVVNPAPVLMTHNEKIEASFLAGLMPETMVSSQWDALLRFGKAHPKCVLKPMHQAQSKGVMLLSWSSATDIEKSRAALSEATDGFQRPALLQKYLPGIENGEQRLWFLDGKLLACVRKLPLKGDFRVNIDGGSALRETTLSASEKKTARTLGKFLKQQKIRLAAIDLIDGFVTDFNFTSPGLITMMEKVLNTDLARPIIRALAKPLG
jgi:glutathione synthase